MIKQVQSLMVKPIQQKPFFEDRQEAGRALARQLGHHRNGKSLLVLALSPGGAIVGAEIARVFGAPMELFRSRRLPVPGDPGLSFGTMTEEGTINLLSDIISRYEIPDDYIQEAISSKRKEILQRRRRFRKIQMGFNVKGRKIILVDEGVTNGAVLFSALDWTRMEGADLRIAALPLIPRDKFSRIREEADETVVLHVVPASSRSMGNYYRRYDPPREEEVQRLLHEVNRGLKAA